MAELKIAEEEALAFAVMKDESSKWVGGRLFRLQDGVWKQGVAPDGGRSLDVEPFSRAYFDLLERIPELRPYAQAFEQVEIQGAAVRIGFRKGGVTTLTPEELEKVRSGFLTGDGGAK